MFHGAVDANGHTRRSRDATGDDVAAMVVVVVGCVVVGCVVVVDVALVVVVLVVVVSAVRHRFALHCHDAGMTAAFTVFASTAAEPDPDFELVLGTLQAEASSAMPKRTRANRRALRTRFACDRVIRCCDITRAIGATDCLA